MKQIFIGGSRHVSHLNDDIRRQLDQIIERRLSVLIGDANGADKAIQRYLQEHAYKYVVVFCIGGECRNNIGGWPVRSVTPPHREKDFAYFTAKDSVMACEADAGLMVWDGQSTGTIVNIARLLSSGKIVSVYILPEKSFFTLNTVADLDKLLSSYPRDVKKKLDHYIEKNVHEYVQSTLF